MISYKTRFNQQFEPFLLDKSQAKLAQSQLIDDVSGKDSGHPRETVQFKGGVKVDDHSQSGTHRSPNKQPKLDRPFSGRLVFRTSAETHEQMAIVADRRGISINRLIEQAVQQSLSRAQLLDADIADAKLSDVAKSLIDDPETSSKLFTDVQPHLADKIDIFRFAEALKRFVLKVGEALEEIDPYLKPSKKGAVASFVCAIANLFDQAMRGGDL